MTHISILFIKHIYIVYLICFRSPYWKIFINVTICGPGLKAPNDEELKGLLLAHHVADVEVEIEESRRVPPS